MSKAPVFTGRAVSILAAVILHLLLLFFAAFTVKTVISAVEERAGVIKLADIREEEPPPVRPPSLPVPSPVSGAENPELAEEVLPQDIPGAGEAIDFLPMHRVSQLPFFPEEEIRKKLVYPSMARRAEVEGTVYLELFVDAQGLVRNVSVLKEDPAERGFGEAAARAFAGLKGRPASANGEDVAVRYRYPVRFQFR
ncbi:MAG: energy transducer TonB [Treponema sp.]|jgi:protein TonB|nr:energy transducer TonB [Treponema sp.]